MEGGLRVFGKLRFFRSMSYQTKLLTVTLFLSLFPVLLLGYASSYLSVRSVQEEVDNNHRIILEQIEYQLNAFLSDLKVSTLQISEDLIVRDSFLAGISHSAFRPTMSMIDTLKKYRSVTRIPFGVTLLYPNHRQAYSTQTGLSGIDARYYSSIMKVIDPGYMGITIISPYTYENQKDLLILKPVSIENAIDGVVVLHVDITKFYEYLRRIDIGSTVVLVVDGQGRIVLSPHAEEIGARLSSTSSLYAYWTSPEATSGISELRGEKYSVTSFKSDQNAWTYVAMTPSRELNAKAWKMERLTWTMVAVIVAVWGCIAFVGYLRMYSPIRRISMKLTPVAGTKKDSVRIIDSYVSDMLETNQRLSGQLLEQLPLMQESVILQLLHDNLSESELLERMKQLDMAFQREWFFTGIVEIDSLHEFMQMYKQKDRTSMLNELQAMLRGVFEANYTCITVNPQPGRIAFIVLTGRTDTATEEAIGAIGSEIRRKTREQFKFTVTAAIAPPVRYLHEIGRSYQLAQEYLGFRHLLGSDVTITRKDVVQSDRIQPADRITAKWYKRILTSMSEGDIALAEKQFNQMFAALPGHLPDFRMIKGILTYFLEEIDQLVCDVQGLTLQDLLGWNPYTELYQQNSLGSAHKWFANRFFPSIKQHIDRMTKDKSRRIADETLKYIHEHYDQDFSLQQLAGEFGVSSSQLSRFFKQAMNVNFVDYVVHYRISKAKEWLVYTEMSIKEISDKLRYTTSQNFTRVFKQITGVPPGKYRNDYRLHGGQPVKQEEEEEDKDLQ